LTLVDLPGFGYAKMARTDAAKITTLLFDYLSRRDNLAALILLIDGRRGPEEEELALAKAIRQRGLQLIIVATKWDKLRNSQRGQALRTFAPIGGQPIPCSATNGEGLEALRHRILDVPKAPVAPPALTDLSPLNAVLAHGVRVRILGDWTRERRDNG
jgi:GTP-binding protein EngB required for normal cell division